MLRKHHPPQKPSRKEQAARATWEMRKKTTLDVSNSSRFTEPICTADLDDSKAVFNSLLHKSTASSNNKTSQSIAR